MEASPGILWALVRLWYTDALVLWRGDKFEENLLPVNQLSTAFQVVLLDRKDGLTLAQALFTHLDGLPEEMYLLRASHIPHEPAPNHPEIFQAFLQLRAKAKEDGHWFGGSMPKYQRDRLEDVDRYIKNFG